MEGESRKFAITVISLISSQITVDACHEIRFFTPSLGLITKGRIFAGIDFGEFLFGYFAGINFRELGFTEDFAGINFRELSLTKEFT